MKVSDGSLVQRGRGDEASRGSLWEIQDEHLRRRIPCGVLVRRVERDRSMAMGRQPSPIDVLSFFLNFVLYFGRQAELVRVYGQLRLSYDQTEGYVR